MYCSVYQDGVKETGVSLAFTVRALDAGPVIASETIEVDDQIKVKFSAISVWLVKQLHLHSHLVS